jgi:hypothetical protein
MIIISNEHLGAIEKFEEEASSWKNVLTAMTARPAPRAATARVTPKAINIKEKPRPRKIGPFPGP